MEAFPAITLLTEDSVLAHAIPAQLQHSLGTTCSVAAAWPDFMAQITAAPPAVALVDCNTLQSGNLPALRQSHPLVALIGIGSAAEAESFAALPLTAFIKRPVAMGGLIRAILHLTYERQLRAGQQQLPLPQKALLQPADKVIRLANGHVIELTDKESALLLCLYHHRHGGLPRGRLLEEVWGYSDAITTHTLETHLYRLRAKLREAFGEQELIVTRNGSYQLKLDEATP